MQSNEKETRSIPLPMKISSDSFSSSTQSPSRSSSYAEISELQATTAQCVDDDNDDNDSVVDIENPTPGMKVDKESLGKEEASNDDDDHPSTIDKKDVLQNHSSDSNSRMVDHDMLFASDRTKETSSSISNSFFDAKQPIPTAGNSTRKSIQRVSFSNVTENRPMNTDKLPMDASASGDIDDENDDEEHQQHTSTRAFRRGSSTSSSLLKSFRKSFRRNNSDQEEKFQVSLSALDNPESRPSIVTASSARNLVGGKYTKRELAFVTTAGIILSFNSGYVNGSCLSGLLTPSAVRQSVSAFTGSYTISALDLASGNNFDLFGRQVSMILSFILGATIAGYMTPNATPYRLEPTYGPTFIIGGVFLTVASILAVFNQDNYLFYFAAAANGIQNGISSIYSANLIRSTHLTGTSTDIGLYLGQILKGNRKNVWKLLVLIALASSFWFGGLISFYSTSYFTHFSLLFNAGMFICIGVAFVSFLVVELDIPVQAAIMGTWMWGKVLDELLRSAGETNCEEFFDNMEGTQDDGALDKEELLDALEKAGIKVSQRQVEVLIRAADKDGDGKIDKDEWMDVARSSIRK